jgi:hypothetical protein
VLQLAVGTANVFGDSASPLVGLNVAATYRQPKGALNPGASATLVNSPSFTVPGTLPRATAGADGFFSTIASGAAAGETSTMTPTAQTAATPTTFGIDGGVFGLGIEPFNYGNAGLPDNTAPYAVPLYDPNAGADTNAFVPWGGPPAFDPNKDGLGVRDGNTYPAGTLGISEGLDVFASVAPATGSYTLSVAVPANTGTTTQKATANLGSTAVLPAVTPATPTLDGNGGGTFAVTLPAGVTEAYVAVTDLGVDPTATTQPTSCNGSSLGTPTYYTFVVRATGTVTLSDAIGPGTPKAPTPSICTSAQNTTADGKTTDGDTFAVQTIGFDYPAYEASYPNSLGNPAPTLAGANGQADVTISSQAQYNQPSTGGIVQTQSKVRAANVARTR